jgi:hypothetical protein
MRPQAEYPSRIKVMSRAENEAAVRAEWVRSLVVRGLPATRAAEAVRDPRRDA